MTNSLDPRLSEAILGIIKDRHPNLVTQEEIYQHLEQNIDFSDQQKQLHHQTAGQIEPNWQHDARNLIHSLKRDGQIISPLLECYGLPVAPQLDPSLHTTHWNGMTAAVSEGPTYIGSYTYTMAKGGIKVCRFNRVKTYLISPNLVMERVDHLVQCGGEIEVSSFHKWGTLANGIILLHPELSLHVEGDQARVVVSDSLLTHSDERTRWVDRAPASDTVAPPPTLRSVPRDAVEEPESSVTVQRRQTTEIQVRYEHAVLNANATMEDVEQVVHRDQVLPRGGGGRQVYCPECGCSFIATRNETKAWFQHEGFDSTKREYMELPPGSPPWEEVRTWPRAWERIHRILGDQTSGQVGPRLHKPLSEEVTEVPIPVFFSPHRTRDGIPALQVWAVSPGEDSAKHFELIDAAETISVDGDTWYRVNSLSTPAEIKTQDGTEPISWPISSRVIIAPGEGGTFVVPRFQYEGLPQGHYHTQSLPDETPDQMVGDIGYSRRQISISYTPHFRLALPTISGSIPWLEDTDIIPVALINRQQPITRISPPGDTDQWSIHGDIHLNASAFRNDSSPLSSSPTVFLSHFHPEAGNCSSRIDMYPSLEIPIAGSTKLVIDDKSYPSQVNNIVTEVPQHVEIRDSDGNICPLIEGKAEATIALKDDSWQTTSGSLDEVLQTLRGLKPLAFVVRISLNSIPTNLIMISKLLPELEPEELAAQEAAIAAQLAADAEAARLANEAKQAQSITEEAAKQEQLEKDKEEAAENAARETKRLEAEKAAKAQKATTPKGPSLTPPSLSEARRRFPKLTKYQFERAFKVPLWDGGRDVDKETWKALKAFVGKPVEEDQ